MQKHHIEAGTIEFEVFDWDDGDREKCGKHGVSLAEIEDALSMIRFVVDDPFEGGSAIVRSVAQLAGDMYSRCSRCGARDCARSVPDSCTRKRWRAMKKPWPALRSDEEAERFVADADLTEYDFSQMVPVRFELRRKDKAVSLRLSEGLLEQVKQAAERRGMPYQLFMRLAIERAVAGEPKP